MRPNTKLKLAAQGFAAAASFNFLSAEFNETVQSFNNYYQKMTQKSATFIVSFNWNWAYKKKTQFPYKTGLKYSETGSKFDGIAPTALSEVSRYQI